ncbi:MAG: M48 family metallopeptidase [Clostridiales bacterium]|nr:M48 family metallopeptidase [Clostridiales bacterium]
MIQPDEIIRSRRKTLAISIDPFGRLIVRAPKSCSTERIFAFLAQKERWILQKKAQTAGAGMRLPPEDLHGYEFMLLGKTCRIALIEKRNILFDEESYTLYLPRKNAKQRLIKWLKENAKRIFTIVTERRAKEMGVSFQSVEISSAKGKWGSCSFDNKIRYAYRLIYAPKEMIEYVVVHELSHVRHKNHSASFWAEVTKYMPDWKNRRKWLKAHGVLLQIF